MAHVRGAWNEAHTGGFAYAQPRRLLCGPRKHRARQKSEQFAAAGHSARVTTHCDGVHSLLLRRLLGFQRGWFAMEKSYTYGAHANWTMHKRGILDGGDIPRTINFAAPPEFGGEPGLWTPEHLLLGAVATCYVATFRAIAEASKLVCDHMEVFVEGRIEKQEGGFRFTQIALRPSVRIEKEEDRERAERLIGKAERACLVSRSLSCEITVTAKIELQEPVTAH